MFNVQVNGVFDEDYIVFEPSNLAIDGSYENNFLNLTIADGNSQDTAQIPIEIDISNQVENNVTTNLNIDGIYQGDFLYITVADGISQDTATIFIDRTEINNFGGGGGDDMSCEGLTQELENCCGAMLNAMANLSLQLTNTEFNLDQSINEVLNQVTIDVSSSVYSDYKCEFPLDDDDEIIPTYAEATLVEKNFQGKGIAGINERLKFLAANQDAMYKEICKAVPPPVSIPLNQTLTSFCSEHQLQTVDDFESENDFFDYIQGQIAQLLGGSILSSLVKRLSFVPGAGVGGFAVDTTMHWATGWLIEKSRAEETQALETICEAIAELEGETITLVASESDLGRVEGNVLILHFVTEDNYPKRARGSNKRE